MKHAITSATYALLQRTLLPIALRGYELTTSGTPVSEGPRLFLAPHLFTLDGYIIGASMPQHFHGIYDVPSLQGKVPLKNKINGLIWQGSGGLNINSDSLKKGMYNVWDNDDSMFAFFEGDTPGMFKKSGKKISEFPIGYGGLPMLLRTVADWDDATKKKVAIQPMSITYDFDKPEYRYGTVPQKGKVHVAFEAPITSRPTGKVELETIVDTIAKGSNRFVDNDAWKAFRKEYNKA